MATKPPNRIRFEETMGWPPRSLVILLPQHVATGHDRSFEPPPFADYPGQARKMWRVREKTKLRQGFGPLRRLQCVASSILGSEAALASVDFTEET
jgi:hypothetical protein